jgi:hypothetical protein
MEEMTKMLSMMTMMRQAMGMDGQQRSGSSIGEIVEAIRELRSAADEVSPQREEPESMMAMLPKVLDIVSAGISKGQPQPEPQEIQPVQLPASFYQQPEPAQSSDPVPVPPTAQAPQPVNQDQQPQTEDEVNHLKYIFKLRSYLSALVDFAVKLAPPETAAQFVVDKLPDELIEIMELPNWFEQLAQVAPEVKKHEEYLRKVRDLALSMIDYEDDPEAPAAD